jgi:hypothetical protein
MKQKRIGENDQELVIPAVYVNGDAKQWAAMTMRRLRRMDWIFTRSFVREI